MTLEDQVRAEIRMALRLTGTSQAELARRLGVSKKHVNQVLLGHATLSFGLAERMLAALGRVLPVHAEVSALHQGEWSGRNPGGSVTARAEAWARRRRLMASCDVELAVEAFKAGYEAHAIGPVAQSWLASQFRCSPTAGTP